MSGSMNYSSSVLHGHVHTAPLSIDDTLARKLLKKADFDGCPIAGRRFEVRQMVGSIYGANVYAGSPPEKGGTQLVLVCRPGQSVTYTEDDV